VCTQLYEYPCTMCKRWNGPKIVVGTDICRLISRSTSDDPICPGPKAKHKIDWKTHYCGLYTTTAAAFFLQYNMATNISATTHYNIIQYIDSSTSSKTPRTMAPPHTSKYLYILDEICSFEREIPNPLQWTASIECFESIDLVWWW